MNFKFRSYFVLFLAIMSIEGLFNGHSSGSRMRHDLDNEIYRQQVTVNVRNAQNLSRNASVDLSVTVTNVYPSRSQSSRHEPSYVDERIYIIGILITLILLNLLSTPYPLTTDPNSVENSQRLLISILYAWVKNVINKKHDDYEV
jgi:hypothetical protein